MTQLVSYYIWHLFIRCNLNPSNFDIYSLASTIQVNISTFGGTSAFRILVHTPPSSLVLYLMLHDPNITASKQIYMQTSPRKGLFSVKKKEKRPVFSQCQALWLGVSVVETLYSFKMASTSNWHECGPNKTAVPLSMLINK